MAGEGALQLQGHTFGSLGRQRHTARGLRLGRSSDDPARTGVEVMRRQVDMAGRRRALMERGGDVRLLPSLQKEEVCKFTCTGRHHDRCTVTQVHTVHHIAFRNGAPSGMCIWCTIMCVGVVHHHACECTMMHVYGVEHGAPPVSPVLVEVVGLGARERSG